MSGGAGDSLAMASEKRGGVELGGGAQQASEGAKARASGWESGSESGTERIKGGIEGELEGGRGIYRKER